MQIFFANILIIIIATALELARSECHYQENTTSSVDFEIEYSDFNDYTVQIICHSDDWTKFPNVTFDSSVVDKIEFINCSFPAMLNVQSICDSMRIKVNDRITFFKLQSNPNRQNLKNLTTPHIKILSSDFNELPFDLFYDAVNVEFVQISHTHLERIPENFFSDWAENLTELYMNNNELQKITKNDFSRLGNVNFIDLSGNQIYDIEPEAFDSLVHLKTLKLGRNRLHTLPLNIFNQMVNLKEIDLGANSFDEIPQDLFKYTKDLKEFRMNRNYGILKTLPRGLFKNLIHLESVHLNNAQLESLPSDLFTGCSELNEVILDYNSLENLPSGLFNDSKNLRSLQIRNNYLKSLPAGIFKGLDRLERLYIDRNRLTSLMPEVLKDLHSVEIFNAADNNLNQIDDQFVLHLKSAIFIDLSNNQLTFKSLREKESSKYQNISSSSMNADADVKLKNIKLRYNKIEKFDAQFVNILKYSEYLDLRNNQISKINLSDFSLKILKRNATNSRGETFTKYAKVDLQDNPLQCDCNLKDFVRHLNGWRENELYNIFVGEEFKCAAPAELKDHNVRNISLEKMSCLLKTTDPNDACKDTCICQEYPEKRILSVDCSYRNLTQLPVIIRNVHNWSIEFNMSGNMLQQCPSLSDSYVTNIKSLDLSNNNITKLTPNLFSSSLQHLKLHGNGMTRLDVSIVDKILECNDTLLSITLHDNEWICDCEARKLVALVQRQFHKYEFGEVKCRETNERLIDVVVSEKCKTEITIMVVSCLLLTFLSIVLGCSVALYSKYKREMKVWLHSKQCCIRVATDDDLDKDKKYDAFISFSHKDKDFVDNEIVAKLEGGSRPYKLCLHYRDWSAEEPIPLQISRSVEQSKRTIVILTPNFLESQWGLFEFRAAHIQALSEGKTRLVVILHGEIGDIEDLEQEIKDYLKLNTYIKWGDPWFWEKLRYALPQAKKPVTCESRNALVVEDQTVRYSVSSSIESSVGDEPEVISMTRDTTSTSDSVQDVHPFTENDNSITSVL